MRHLVYLPLPEYGGSTYYYNKKYRVSKYVSDERKLNGKLC